MMPRSKAGNSCLRILGGLLLLLSGLARAEKLTQPDVSGWLQPLDFGQVRLITYIDRPTVNSEKGKPAGAVVDLVRRLFDQAEIPYDMVLMPQKRALLVAATQERHCVFPIQRSQEREAAYAWIGPIRVARHGFYAKPGNDIHLVTLDDARPYRLGSYLGSGVGEALLEQGFRIDFADRNELNARKLLLDRFDLMIADTTTVPWMAEAIGAKLGDPLLVFFTTLDAMGCNPKMGRSQIKRLNDELVKLHRDGILRNGISP